jgi:hypothetical protein
VLLFCGRGRPNPISPWVVEMVPKSSMYFSGASDTQVVFFCFLAFLTCLEARPLVSNQPILIKSFFGSFLLEFEYVGK